MFCNLKDRVAVITGGAKGIGYEIADKFLKNNAKVVILLDIDDNQGTVAAKQLNDTYGSERAVFIKCDVTKDIEDVSKEIFEKYKVVDVLVNNAGVYNESEVIKTIDINMVSVIVWSLKFHEHMRKDRNGKGGTIINVSSILGFRICEFAPIYQSTKFATFGFTKSLGHINNYKRTTVRVVAVCPGFTTTTIGNGVTMDEDVIEECREFLKKQEWQSPDVVGEAVVEVFNTAPSGTNWVIEGAKPIYKV